LAAHNALTSVKQSASDEAIAGAHDGATRQALHIVRKQEMMEMMLLELTVDALNILNKSFWINY